MGKFSDTIKRGLKELKDLGKIANSNTHAGINTASGQGRRDPMEDLLLTAIGGLFGKPEANKEQPIIAYIKANKQKTHGKSIGELILGLQGGLDDSTFSKMIENQKTFFDELIKTKFTDKFKKFSDLAIKFMSDDASWLKNIKDALNKDDDKESDENAEAELDVKGGTDFEKVLKAISEFKMDKETEESLKKLADMTGKNGCITTIFDNINRLNNNNINFDAFSENMKKMDKASKESVEMGNSIDEKSIKSANNNMENYAKFILCAIGIGMLFITVGLLSKFLDYEGILKFDALLLAFLLGVTAIYVLAAKILKSGGDVMQGIKDYMYLVTVSGTIFILIGLTSKFMDIKATAIFAGMLLVFLLGVVGVYALAGKLLQNGSPILQGIEDYSYLVIVSAGILIVGGLMMKIININDLLTFTATLLLFLLGLVGVYALMNKASKNVMHGIKDFTTMVISSAIIMVLGALLNSFIPWKDVIGFTFKLGLFLLILTGIFFLWNKLKGETMEAIRDAIIAVGVASIILVLGALINNIIPFADVIGFVVKLGIFLLMLTGIMALWNKLKIFTAKGLKDAVIAVGIAAFVLFLGALTFKLISYADLFGFLFYLAFLLFGIIVVTMAVSIAQWMGGKSGKSNVIKDAIFLVVSATFIMFLGAVAFKYVDKTALTGFIITFDLFLTGLIAVLMPLIVAAGIFDKGADVIKSVAIFVGLAAATMLIGSAAIMMWPDLIWSIPVFTTLLDLFLLSVTLTLIPLIAVAGIFPLGGWVIGKIKGIITRAALIMLVGGGLIIKYPNLVWAIPVFLLYLGIMLTGMGALIKWVAKNISMTDVKKANIALQGINESLFISTICFGLLALIVKNIGGWDKFAMLELLAVTIVAVITALATLMVAITGKGRLSTQKAVDRGVMAINGVAVAVGIMSGAFFILALVQKEILKNGGLGTFEALVWTLTAVLGLLTFAIVGAALALGNGVTTAMAYAAIGVILAAAGAFAIVCASVIMIAHALKILSTIKSFDATPLIKGVGTIMSLVAALTPLAFAAPFIAAVSLSLMALTKLVSKMAEAVKEYADLKIGVYAGTQLIGYRHLTKKDFDEAAKNISLIVTTLTRGIMEAYKDNPEWYGATNPLNFISNIANGGTPLERVIRQSYLLAPLLSKITNAVKEYADLKISIYEGKEVVGYRSLKKKDFKNAADNVSLAVTALTEGIMKAYKDHKEWYGATFSMASFSDWILGNSENGTPLERVIAQNMKLAPLISKIASAVEEVANLKFATKWDDKGNPIKYKIMNNKDFKSAADNVSLAVTTLTDGIMKAYKDHPERYEATFSIASFSDWILGNSKDGTPLERVIAQNMKLAPLISKISESLKDYADLKFATKWDDKGTPIKFKQMKDKDFEDAGHNISTVLVTITNAIMDVYKEHDDWYNSDSWFKDSDLIKVINVNLEISKLISTVADSIKNYAQLMIPDDWDKEGKAISFHLMTPDEFKNAGEGIGKVLTTVTQAILGYDVNGNETSYRKIIQKYMIDGDEDEFNLIVDNATKISTIISGMADGISKYAKMLVPDDWDPKTGTPTHYVRMDAAMMKDAGEGIGTIITWVATTLFKVYEDNKAMFGWNEEEKEFDKDSPIQHVIDSVTNIGSVISGVANGLSQYAELKIPKRWDKHGNPILFEKVSETFFTDASKNISKIILTMGGTLMGLYAANSKMFTLRTKTETEGGFLGFGGTEVQVPIEEQTPFERIVDASVKMATIIGEIAKSLQMFADKKVVTGGKDGKTSEIVEINEQTLELAKSSITDVLTSVADTFVKLSKPPYSTYFSEETIETIVEPIGSMMQVVATMSTALQNLAQLRVPIDWNEKGEATKFRNMNRTDFEEASANIKTILGALGEAFLSVATDHRASWVTGAKEIKQATKNWMGRSFTETVQTESEGNDITPVIEGISALATVLQIISGCIFGYATMRFPMGTDKDGDMMYCDPLTDEDLRKCKENIVLVVSTLGQAMQDITQAEAIKWLTSEENEDLIDNVNGAVTNVIEFLQSCVDSLKEFVDSEGVQAIKKIQTTFDNIIPVMKNIISDIGTLLKLFFDGNGLSANKDESDGSFKIEITSSSFYIILHAYEEYIDKLPNKFKSFTNMLTDICTTLQNMTDPIKDAMPSINELHKIFTKDKFNDKLKLIIVNIADMLTSISKIGELDKLFIIDIDTEGTGVGNNSFGGLMKQLKGAGQLDGEDRENVNKAVDKLKSRMEVYTDLMIYVIQKLRSVNDNLSSLQVIDGSVFGNAIGNFFGAIKVIKNELEGTSMFDVMSISMMISGYSWALEKLISTIEKTKNIGEANFSTLTGGIVAINRALAGINQKTLNNFKQQNAQIDKLVKIINSTKLINLIQLNAFANSMNKLAAKMGNLDKLTEAISNKLTTVLEKLVKRLEHAEATIVKADEIQKRRHELIQKATQEVKSLMETPMKVEIAPSADMAAMSQASTATDTTATATDSSAETAATQENNGQKKTDDKSKTTTDTKKTSGS